MNISEYLQSDRPSPRYPQIVLEEEVIGNLFRVILYDIWCIVDRIVLVTDNSDLPLKHFGDFLYDAQQDLKSIAAGQGLWLSTKALAVALVVFELLLVVVGVVIFNWTKSKFT